MHSRNSGSFNQPSIILKYILIPSVAIFFVFLGATVFTQIVYFFGTSSNHSLIVDQEFNEWEWKMSSEEEQYSKLERTFPRRLTKCLQDADECPKYATGQLEKDWPLRFVHKNHGGGCYFEYSNYPSRCPELCQDLFQNGTQYKSIGHKIATVCKIGCGYAQLAKSKQQETCMQNCKNTVWGYQPEMKECNLKNGLGIGLSAGTMYQDVLGEEEFEIGKACEFGCIIGNERPCPSCEIISSTGINRNTVTDI